MRSKKNDLFLIDFKLVFIDLQKLSKSGAACLLQQLIQISACKVLTTNFTRYNLLLPKYSTLAFNVVVVPLLEA